MAHYILPADKRGEHLGQNINQGLMMMLQNKLQQGNMDKRFGLVGDQAQKNFENNQTLANEKLEQAKMLENWKREQLQNQARTMFQPQRASVPNAEGQDPLMIQPEFTPENTQLPQGMLNRMMMGMMGGFNPQSMMPTTYKPNIQAKDGSIITDGKVTGSYPVQPKEFAPYNEPRPEVLKLVEALSKHKEGTPQYKIIKQRLDKLSTNKMNPFEMMFMEQYGLTPNGGTTSTKTVDDFFTNE